MKSRLISFVAALVLAAIAAGAVLLYTSSAELRALEDQQSTTVLVSVAEIPAGTRLGDAWNQGLLIAEVYPATSVPSNPITVVDDSNSSLLALSGIAPGQILISSSFGTEIFRPTGLVLPDGKVAVAVEIGDTARVANFVRPGNQVSIFITMQGPDPDEPTQAEALVDNTFMLVERAFVLAIGPVTAQTDVADGQVPPSVVVTFAVTQKEAEELIHSRVAGSLYLTLLDETTEVSKTPGVTNKSLFLD